MKTEKIGVILLNLGGPERISEVVPFLYNLFSDRDIIRLGPKPLQKPLAWLIAHKRAGKSRRNYSLIGGGSPLTRITLEQERALQETLQADGMYKVVTAMRYWQPRAVSALKKLTEERISKMIALPLYPQYSSATTGSSFADLRREISAAGLSCTLREIDSWQNHPLYVSCLAQYITEGLAGFPGRDATIVYSAHSLPAELVEKGDPYVDQLKETIQGLEQNTGHRGILCFQSRSGPVRWLAPSTPETLRKLAGQGCKNVLMVPLSFVSDHVETLYEINILYRKMAAELGMRLESTRSLNTDPTFIECLRALVIEKAREFES